jgi:hypothetical protein
MKDILPDPYGREADPRLQRVVGVLALAAGVPFALLFILVLVRTAGRLLDEPALILGVLAVLALIAGFLLSVGWRLTFNRPNSYKSLLAPNAWFAIALLFLLLAAWLAVSMIRAGNFARLYAPAYSILLGVGAAAVGVRAKKQAGSQKNAA